MHKIEEVLRLRHTAGLSLGQIAAALGLSKGVVAKYVNLAQSRGIGWPLPAGLDRAGLADLLLANEATATRRFEVPDFGQIHVELKRKGVTLQLLWAEYAAQHGNRPTATASSASTTAAGAASRSAACDSATWPATSCSSTTAARRCR